MNQTRLVLASTSPRRRALIELLGFDVRLADVEIDEDAYLLPNPLAAALNIAAAKAAAVVPQAEDIVLAADTLVVVDDEILGKPTDAQQAYSMLSKLRSRGHHVLSGVVLRAPDGLSWGGVVTTRVFIRAYDAADAATYIARGEPFDKAGGYAIQDTEFKPVEKLDGCYLNVVGLPLCAVAAGLATFGVDINRDGDARPPCSFCRRGAPLVALRSGY